MEDGGEKARDQSQSVAIQELAARRRIFWQVSRRSQLGRVESDLFHLGEHPVGRHPVTPPRQLTDAPRDGRAGNLERSLIHPTSSTWTGRCSLSERSAASATASAWRASVTVHALSVPSVTAARKPCSSAR